MVGGRRGFYVTKRKGACSSRVHGVAYMLLYMYTCVYVYFSRACVCVCVCVCVCTRVFIHICTYDARTKRTIQFIARNDRCEQVKENRRIDRFPIVSRQKTGETEKGTFYSGELRTRIVFPRVTSETRLTSRALFRSIPEPEE